MIGRLVAWSLRRRLLVLLATIGIIAWGIDSYRRLPIDAFPDVSPVQVLVAIQAPGLPPEELEAQVTNPAEVAMKGIPNLVGIRSTTRYAVALMTFEFAPGTDIYWARTQVDQRLDDLASQLPDGVSRRPRAGRHAARRDADVHPDGRQPLAAAASQPARLDHPAAAPRPTRHRRRQHPRRLRPHLRSGARPGGDGGARHHHRDAGRGLQQNNRNDGAGRVRDGEEALLVRAEGRIRTMEDIRAIVVAAHPTGVVRISDVADVRFGALARNGVVTTNGESEAVWAIVLGLRGANAKVVVSSAKAKLAQIQKSLPEGVKIEIFYDRNDLIEKAVWTVQKVLLEAIALVSVLLILFLGNLRAALVVSLALPLAVLSTFVVMRLTGISANIMSLGGLAIAIGLLVDCSVVVVENTAHHFAHAHGRTDFRSRCA